MQNTRPSENSILIVGGGTSGILLAIQLLRQPDFKGTITVVNNRYPAGRGIAYSTRAKEHLLNVRAGRMSLFPDKPDDFSEWVQSNAALSAFHGPGLSEKFIPRAYYGDYVLQRLDETLKITGAGDRFRLIEDEVTDLELQESSYRVQLASGREFTADKVVLATGNTPPEYLPGFRELKDPRIIVNPWSAFQAETLDKEQDVMVIGSSLTMADTVLSLKSAGFKGKIHVLSRHGKLPVTHPAERPSGHPEIQFEPSKDLNLLYRQIKERIRMVIHNMHWQEPVLEAIRPHTQTLWQQFSTEQKLRFLRHLNHRWSILRHRIPAEVCEQLTALRHQGQLHLYAGQLTDIDTTEPLLKVRFDRKPENVGHLLSVQRVINCTGPEGNPEKMNRPLIRNLLRKGMIRPDDLHLGYDALPDGSIRDAQGRVNGKIFTIGPGLRGILWESTAVPEIRMQAGQLARLLL